jgi:hypothetical protein
LDKTIVTSPRLCFVVVTAICAVGMPRILFLRR